MNAFKDEESNEAPSLEGTIANFCKENNINQHQLYYQRKRLGKELKLGTFQKALFVFCNKQMNKLKILNFDEGFWLYYYRLESNRFKWLMTKEINNLKNELAYLKGQILNKNKKIFGQSSEQVDCPNVYV